MQSVLNVTKNVKFHSNQTEADLYIAENVTLNEDPREEIIDIKLQASIYSQLNLFFITTFFPVLSVFGTELWVKRLNRIPNYDVYKEDMKCLLLKLLSASKMLWRL